MIPCRPQIIEAGRSNIEHRSNDDGRRSKVSSFLLPPSSLILPASFRSGATLTEVLMSMLIFSIGVVSIFSLFPISIVRSIRATQLTSSKLFEENFTQLLRMNPDLLTAHTPATLVSAPGAGTSGGPWRPHQPYRSVSTYPNCDLVTPGVRTSGLLPEPFGLYACLVVDLPAGTVSSTTQYPSDVVTPNWQVPNSYVLVNNNPSANSFLNNVPWSPDDGVPGDSIAIRWVPVSGHWFNLTARGYVVDPLGFWTVFGDNGGASVNLIGTLPVQAASQFGKRADRTGTSPAAGTAGNLNESAFNSVPGWGNDGDGSTTHLPRINGGIGLPVSSPPNPVVTVPMNLATARRIASYPDSWTVDYAGAATSVTTTSVTLPPNSPISATLSNNVNMRIVLRSAGGRSTTRTVTSIGGSPNAPVIGWSSNQPLPTTGTTSITVSDVTDVRIESFDARYTWLATVNNRVPGRPRITVAVYFNRKFTPGAEHVYKAVFGNQTLTTPPGALFQVNQDPAFAGTAVGSLTSDQVLISWDVSGSSPEPAPTISEGNYLFDAVNVDWYQIVDVTSTPAPSGHSAAIVTLDRPVTTITPATGLVGRAMLPLGIVKLFEL